MKSFVCFLPALLLGALLLACGGAKVMTHENTSPVLVNNTSPCPDWFSNPPQSEDYLFAPATATSRDLQLAINKAMQEGRANLGAQVESRMQALTQQFKEEIGEGESAQLDADFTIVSKTVVSTTLRGSRVKNQTATQEGGLWRACVLMEYPLGAARAKFLEAIKENEPLRQKLASTESFRKLDTETEKFDMEKRRKAGQN